jgi:hypothetical protein
LAIFHSEEIEKGVKLEVVHRSRGRVTPSSGNEGIIKLTAFAGRSQEKEQTNENLRKGG